MTPRVCVIGLDCLAPTLLFDRLRGQLPTFDRLREEGVWGPLASSVPPITIPAWGCMVTGRDPGELGLYGFRGRGAWDYHERKIPTALDVPHPTLWQRLSRAGKRCRVLGVPLSYPAVPLRGGRLLSGPLTPSGGADSTYPPELWEELVAAHGQIRFDVEDFRRGEGQKDDLLRELYALSTQRFDIARDWTDNGDWDFFMMVDMAPDRLHHAFWRYSDPSHPEFEAGHPYENAVPDFYRFLDDQLRRLLEKLRPTDHVLVVSDHGAQNLMGSLALNQWLIAEGYLVLKEDHPTGPGQSLLPGKIDWSKTQAWADGGYVGRVYFNVAQREPNGIVAAEDIAALADRIVGGLCALRKPDGEVVAVRSFRPEECYAEAIGYPPDLTIYLDDLALRAVGTLGHPALFLRGHDGAPDDANHATDGVFIMHGGPAEGEREGLTLYDIAPTVLNLLDQSVPEGLRGRIIS